MATVLLSFIGTVIYQSCKYVYNEMACETHLFPSAINNFFRDADRLIVFLTDEAEKAKRKDDDITYFEQLREGQSANNLLIPELIKIKSGKNQAELWEIFETIASSLNENDEVVFDITHAFRSLPLLSFLVIAFLRETKNIKLKAILYGAFEAKYKDDKGLETTPVFDLSPFIELLDWLSATKQFKNTGNANFLVELLHSSQDTRLSTSISALSDSLRLLRPSSVMDKSLILSKQLSNEENRKRIKSKPFLELLESVEKSYSKFGLEKPIENKVEFIARLIELANWYFEKGQYVQSIATIRETIATIVCHKLKLDFFKSKDNRTLAEGYLNQRDNEPINYEWKDTNLPIELKELWKSVTDLRNDVLHVGFNESPRSTNKVIKQNKEFLDELKEILG